MAFGILIKLILFSYLSVYFIVELCFSHDARCFQQKVLYYLFSVSLNEWHCRRI